MQARAVIVAVAGLLLMGAIASAGIYQWEYINPAQPELGKKRSLILCPDGAGVSAEPGAFLALRDLTQAYLIGSDLTAAYFYSATLTEADLGNADLSNAYFYAATLTNANFGNAVVNWANFDSTTSLGFTAAQLYSTASYAGGNLRGIYLSSNDLTGWNFSGKNLTVASFYSTTLTNADLTNANLTAASFYSATLTNADLTNANLTGASFYCATLTNANLGNAVVNWANFDSTTSIGFTAAQLYSTASYAGGNLTGIYLSSNDLTGWDFSGKDLTAASFSLARLTGADLTNANLTDVDFSFADVRGAIGVTSSQWLSTSSHRNAIYTDGTIDGLSLQAGDHLVLRDNPIAITVVGIMSLVEGSELEMLLDESAWDSTISLQAGIPITLGGTLHLTPADGVDGESLLGRTFDLFNWNGVLSEDNRFDAIVSMPGYLWDTSKLYTTGEVALTATRIAGDADGDGVVDAADYIWLKQRFGLSGAAAEGADLDGLGTVDWADLQILMTALNAVGAPSSPTPEPATLAMLAIGGLAMIRRRRK